MPMRTNTIDVTLSADEWALISALRAVPESPLKQRVGTLLETLLDALREPRCAEMQGDGVPCDSATAQCDQCVHVAAMIDTLSSGLLRAAATSRTVNVQR